MPYSSGGRPATALSATFEISWPSYAHAFVPSARVMNFGARSAYFSGRRPSKRCGGSTTWSSTLTKTMSSMFMAPPLELTIVSPATVAPPGAWHSSRWQSRAMTLWDDELEALRPQLREEAATFIASVPRRDDD